MLLCFEAFLNLISFLLHRILLFNKWSKCFLLKFGDYTVYPIAAEAMRHQRPRPDVSRSSWASSLIKSNPKTAGGGSRDVRLSMAPSVRLRSFD